YARVKIALCCAKASRLGVKPRFDPKKPMRSARVVSIVIRMIFEGFATFAGCRIAGFDWAVLRDCASKMMRKNRAKDCMTDEKKSSTMQLCPEVIAMRNY